jgi:hypothetical protein
MIGHWELSSRGLRGGDLRRFRTGFGRFSSFVSLLFRDSPDGLGLAFGFGRRDEFGFCEPDFSAEVTFLD